MHGGSSVGKGKEQSFLQVLDGREGRGVCTWLSANAGPYREMELVAAPYRTESIPNN